MDKCYGKELGSSNRIALALANIGKKGLCVSKIVCGKGVTKIGLPTKRRSVRCATGRPIPIPAAVRSIICTGTNGVICLSGPRSISGIHVRLSGSKNGD